MSVSNDLEIYIFDEVQAISSLIMIPICFFSAFILLHYAVSKGALLFYFRLILAVLIMLFYYSALLIACVFGASWTPSIDMYNNFLTAFKFDLVENAFRLHCIPTVLYCWQYYDVIASVKTHMTTVWDRVFAWARGLLAVALCTSTVVFWILYAYFSEAAIYYDTPSKHYSMPKFRHAHQMTMHSVTALEIVNISECLVSISFLIGIIWQCNQITKATHDSGQDQLLSFKRVDYLFVLMHCVLLLS
jgi:hypothetical protein